LQAVVTGNAATSLTEARLKLFCNPLGEGLAPNSVHRLLEELDKNVPNVVLLVRNEDLYKHFYTQLCSEYGEDAVERAFVATGSSVQRTGHALQGYEGVFVSAHVGEHGRAQLMARGTSMHREDVTELRAFVQRAGEQDCGLLPHELSLTAMLRDESTLVLEYDLEKLLHRLHSGDEVERGTIADCVRARTFLYSEIRTVCMQTYGSTAPWAKRAVGAAGLTLSLGYPHLTFTVPKDETDDDVDWDILCGITLVQTLWCALCVVHTQHQVGGRSVQWTRHFRWT
jgi:hypothetical protein